MANVDAHGHPVGPVVHSASPAEGTLVDNVRQSIPGEGWPKRLIGDKAYDSDKRDRQLLRDGGITVIARNEQTDRKRRTAGKLDD